ncbi:MAG: TonB family protein [Candidatus Latescibacteria bacterium]|nr:TonB family protein [Candidatus Latescibacterota bacterium]
MVDLSQRVPIGAADLKANAQRLFRKALVISAAIHLGLVGIYILSTVWKPKDEAAYTGRVIRMTTLPPPPPLSAAPPPPVIPINQEIVKPTIGTPVPVPDAQAPEQTIMTQQEIAAMTAPVGLGGSGKDSLVIATGDDLPSEGEFVYYEDEPVPVTQVQPAYPEFAREAQIQGKVVLHVLVGKDGRVKNVKVMRGVTGLNEAAVDAIKKWVFKPALSNNKPVAVWVEVPMDFHF